MPSEILETPYTRIGGAACVRRIADAFYDAMDTDPAFAKLRAMHAPDLAPMRESLTGFLTAWLGGPRDWLQAQNGFCIMSRHARLAVTAETAEQWAQAMRRAIAAAGVEPELAAKMQDALAQMAGAMAR